MNEALQLASVDIGASVEGLKDAAAKAAAAVKVVDNITKAFSIAGAAIELGATILHPTPARSSARWTRWFVNPESCG